MYNVRRNIHLNVLTINQKCRSSLRYDVFVWQIYKYINNSCRFSAILVTDHAVNIYTLRYLEHDRNK